MVLSHPGADIAQGCGRDNPSLSLILRMHIMPCLHALSHYLVQKYCSLAGATFDVYIAQHHYYILIPTHPTIVLPFKLAVLCGGDPPPPKTNPKCM